MTLTLFFPRFLMSSAALNVEQKDIIDPHPRKLAGNRSGSVDAPWPVIPVRFWPESSRFYFEMITIVPIHAAN